MTHRFPIKEIALQSGLSTATVDRVINERPNVSAQSRARVAAAIEELTLQEGQLAARGRRMFVDVLVEAPKRFSSKIRAEIEALLPAYHPAVIRPRFTFQEVMSEAQTTQHLDRIAARGSSGVLLKARDVPVVRDAVSALTAKGIPVVTMFTDVEAQGRLAYVGADNAQAGRTAAYLMTRILGGAKGAILLTQSQDSFAGEEARAAGFRNAIAGQGFRLLYISGGAGLSMDTASQIAARAGDIGQLSGVYSMGGGNRAILDALDRIGAAPQVYIAHDLDAENTALLRSGAIDFVLEHDLSHDLRLGFDTICHAHGLGPAPVAGPSDIQVLTPPQIP